MNRNWKVTDISKAIHLGIIEFQDNKNEWHMFEVMETPEKLVFGGATNTGFLESGYIYKDDYSTDEALQYLHEELLNYYNLGGNSSNITCNDRM